MENENKTEKKETLNYIMNIVNRYYCLLTEQHLTFVFMFMSNELQSFCDYFDVNQLINRLSIIKINKQLLLYNNIDIKMIYNDKDWSVYEQTFSLFTSILLNFLFPLYILIYIYKHTHTWKYAIIMYLLL